MKTNTRPIAALATLFLGVAHGSAIQYCPSNAKNVCYSVGIPSVSASSGSGNIYFQMTAPTTYAWVALGTGTEMDGSNIFLMYQDGNGNVTLSARLGTFHTEPTTASGSTLTLLEGSGVNGSMMTANVMCSNCESWSGGTLSLTSSSSGWIAGWNTGSSLATTSTSASIAQHDDTSTFNLDLTKATISSDSNPFVSSASTNSSSGSSGGGSSSGSGSGSGSDSGSGSSSGGDTTSGSGVTIVGADRATMSRILTAHGVIMAIVFVVLYPLGSLMMPAMGNWKAHAAVQMISFALMWAGFGLGVQAAQDRNLLFKQSHTVFGTVIPCLLVIQPSLGFIHHKMHLKTGGRTPVSYAHIFYGRILMVLGIVNGGLGLQLASASNSLVIAYSVIAAVLFVLYMAGALMGSLRRMKQPSAAAVNKEAIQLQDSPNHSQFSPTAANGARGPYGGAQRRA